MNRHDLGLLGSLDVILEEANVTRAAARLRVTQPALSAQLSRLRKLLADPLLVPVEKGRGMRLTTRAMALRAPLHDLIAELGKLVEAPQPFDPHTARRDFQIVVNDNAASMIGLDLIDAVRRESGPGLRIGMRQVEQKSILDLAAKGAVDLVVGSEAIIPDGMRSKVLLSDRFQVAQRKRHPRGTGRFTLKSYCAHEHILVSSSGSFRSRIDEALERQGLKRHVALSVQYYTMVPSLLQRSDLVATLPSRFIAQFSRQLDAFDLPFEQPLFHLAVGWHPRCDDDAGIQWLLAKLDSAIARAMPSPSSRRASVAKKGRDRD